MDTTATLISLLPDAESPFELRLCYCDPELNPRPRRWCSPQREPKPKVTLDWNMFPHIFESILENADTNTLKAIRGTNRAVNAMASHILRFRYIRLTVCPTTQDLQIVSVCALNGSTLIATPAGFATRWFEWDANANWAKGIMRHTRAVVWELGSSADLLFSWPWAYRGATWRLRRLFARVTHLITLQGGQDWIRWFVNLQSVTTAVDMPDGLHYVLSRPLTHYTVIVNHDALAERHHRGDWGQRANHKLKDLEHTNVTFLLHPDVQQSNNWGNMLHRLMIPFRRARSLSVVGQPECVSSLSLDPLYRSPMNRAYEPRKGRKKALAATNRSFVSDRLKPRNVRVGALSYYSHVCLWRRLAEDFQANERMLEDACPLVPWYNSM